MPEKSLYSEAIARKLANSARKKVVGRFHVISGDEKTWKVVASGKLRALRIFSTQKSAISFARNAARKHAGEIIVHDTNGRIKNTISLAV